MANRGSLRASDADREQIVERLRQATAEGRLAAHELEQRLVTALSARTYADLDATVADLPGKRVTHRRPHHRAVATVAAHPILLLAAIPVVIVAVAMLAAISILWMVFVTAWALLGHRGHRYPGPWAYANRRAYGSRPRSSAPPRGYWA